MALFWVMIYVCVLVEDCCCYFIHKLYSTILNKGQWLHIPASMLFPQALKEIKYACQETGDFCEAGRKDPAKLTTYYKLCLD